MKVSIKGLTSEELNRYRRHITLKEIGEKGQIKLKNSSVIFIGAGGLGSSALLYTAAAGIGKIGIVDNDLVENSNLQRQIIHDTQEIGNNKTESAKKRIKQLNPNCEVITFEERLNTENILKIIDDFDIVCDCSDNFGTRYLINDACIILKKPFLYGCVQGFEGQISVFNLYPNSPNLRDLIPKSPHSNEIPSCEEFGVLGVSPGLIGILQANEIIKILTNNGEILDGKILIFNLLEVSIKKLNLKANLLYRKIDNLFDFREDYENIPIDKKTIKTINNIQFQKIFKKDFNEILIIDVRDKEDFQRFSLKGSLSIPLSDLNSKNSLNYIKSNFAGKKIFTICQKGIRSAKASEILMNNKIQSQSLEGGIDQLNQNEFVI